MSLTAWGGDCEGAGPGALRAAISLRPRARNTRATLLKPRAQNVRSAHGGKLDVLVANAGILGRMQPPEAVEEDNWCARVLARRPVGICCGGQRRARGRGAASHSWRQQGARAHPRFSPPPTRARRNVFAVNVDGVFHCARAAHPLLKAAAGAKVVITSSVAGALTLLCACARARAHAVCALN